MLPMCKCCQLGNVANVQVLPVSSVANFQLSEGCRGAGRSGKSAASPRCGALVCAGEFARAFLWGVGGAFYRRQDGGSPYGRSR